MTLYSIIKELAPFKNKPYHMLQKIYDITDTLISNNPYQKDIQCKKGCSYCCHIDIYTTEIEANTIAKKYNKKLNKKNSHTKEHRTACPFLINNECSIYKDRPFVCRTHQVYTEPINCSDNKEHTYKYFNDNISQLESLMFQSMRIRDIRDWFKA